MARPNLEERLPRDFKDIIFTIPKAGETAGVGTVIGEIKCRACGKPNHVKVNKAGKVYFYCNHHHPQNDEPCNGDGGKWSGPFSRALIAYRSGLSRKPATEVQPDATPEEKPKPAPVTVKPGAGDDAPKPAAAKRPAARKPAAGTGTDVGGVTVKQPASGGTSRRYGAPWLID